MFEKIENTIAHVRTQPEHIRMRWVWGSVIAVMIFVIIVWMMSLRVSFLRLETAPQSDTQPLDDIQKQIDEISETMPQQSPNESISIDELLERGAVTQ
ncbi:MAG: hypothetical protein CR954_00305 [Candidatus Moraniibacteriota bacterium]|nr:MAG: hypothetical protein CR954_00305 [Candidatus Moranbacteria bacterium]